MNKVDENGLNIDPTLCDCGKDYFCPLWTEEWANFYNINLNFLQEVQLISQKYNKPTLLNLAYKVDKGFTI